MVRALVVFDIPVPIPVAASPRRVVFIEHHATYPNICAASRYLQFLSQSEPVEANGSGAT